MTPPISWLSLTTKTDWLSPDVDSPESTSGLSNKHQQQAGQGKLKNWKGCGSRRWGLANPAVDESVVETFLFSIFYCFLPCGQSLFCICEGLVPESEMQLAAVLICNFFYFFGTLNSRFCSFTAVFYLWCWESFRRKSTTVVSQMWFPSQMVDFILFSEYYPIPGGRQRFKYSWEVYKWRGIEQMSGGVNEVVGGACSPIWMGETKDRMCKWGSVFSGWFSPLILFM